MDALTAGMALVAVQLCVALIMAGTFQVTREEQCTRYWALSGALLAPGVLAVVIDVDGPQYPWLIIGNSFLIAGIVFQWWGLQSFHGRQPSRSGWALIAVFLAVYTAFVMNDADGLERAALFSATAMICYLLCFGELMGRRQKSVQLRLSFANALAIGASAVLAAGMGFRAIACVLRMPDYAPKTSSSIGVVVVYILPLAGTLLFSVALLLLYFERLVEAKHHLATHDELTGLHNRRAIIQAGEREISLAMRSHSPLTVAYIDVDHFKQINDKFGHENGDSVLIELARVLKSACRDTDILGRYGGEEFCGIFPGTDDAKLDNLGERLLRAVRNHRFKTGIKVTISIGFAVLRSEDASRSWSSLMHGADTALFHAKECGRNQFCIWKNAIQASHHQQQGNSLLTQG